MSLRAGTRLDQYEILAPIGSGAMGDVYKAKDTRLDRVVALKVITASRDLDLQARDRFDREARALAALSHPHICDVYHYGEDAGTPYLVMEYLEGRTVAERLKTAGRLPIPEVLRYGTEIADALCAAHHAGIVHRDLKPENVMLTDGGAKLLDLGISKRLPAGGSHWYGGTTQLALTRLGDRDRDHSLHGAGAARRPRARRPLRHLLVRRGALRDGDGDARVPRRQRGADHREHHVRGARARVCDRAVGPRGPRRGARALPEKGARRPISAQLGPAVRDARGARRRSACSSCRPAAA
jgi:serine/threonine protein kinase